MTEKLIEFPSLTVKHISDTHNVNVQAANDTVGRLTEAGTLEAVTGRSYNRVSQAPAVLDILFLPVPTPTRWKIPSESGRERGEPILSDGPGPAFSLVAGAGFEPAA